MALSLGMEKLYIFLNGVREYFNLKKDYSNVKAPS